MKAVYLIKFGKADTAFDIKYVPDPKIKFGEVLIEVEAFGLNYSEVMARKGFYQEVKKLPTMLGYDVLGRVVKSKGKKKEIIGKRVVAISSNFDGYATLCAVDERACIEIPEKYSLDKALGLGLQYMTAWLISREMNLVRQNEITLVHAGAGGVGLALTQLLKLNNCKVLTLCSNEEKRNRAVMNGADVSLIYSNHYEKDVEEILIGERVDVIFNATMGWTFKKDLKILSSGGRFVCYGVASMTNTFSQIKSALDLAFFNLIPFLINSNSLVLVNALNLGRSKPFMIENSVNGIRNLFIEEKINPIGGGVYSIDELALAHEKIEKRESIGKLAVRW